MTETPRWIARATAEAEACRVRLPWERGLRRQAFIRRRAARAAAAEARPDARPDARRPLSVAARAS